MYAWTFWIGWVLLGMLAPMGILFHPALGIRRGAITIAALLVVAGGLSGDLCDRDRRQAFPLNMFPGHTIIASGYYDGVRDCPSLLISRCQSFCSVSLALPWRFCPFIGVRMLQFSRRRWPTTWRINNTRVTVSDAAEWTAGRLSGSPVFLR